jgi:hypothetical protein
LIATKQIIDSCKIAGLFERIEVIKQLQAEQFFIQFTDFIPRFLKAQKEGEIMGRKYAPSFNIFRFLKFERQEELHSRFITFLLNPRESHGQGHLFLDTFLKIIKSKYPDFLVPETTGNRGTWLVQREVFTKFGHMDIVLRNPLCGVMYVIENKVDAGEQLEQIKRYGDYLKKHVGDSPIQGLLFLTVSGYFAQTAGTTQYYPIAYISEIQDWLTKVLPDVEAVTVRETIRQYLFLIQSL